MERFSHKDFEKFQGNWNLFKEVFNNENILIMYDLDGILVYSAKSVVGNFKQRTGIDVHPSRIDGWEYLKQTAIMHNLTREIIDTSEDDWYNTEVLERSVRHPHAKHLVRSTVNRYGADRNLILTSRNPYFKASTQRWMARNIPMIPTQNLIIRSEENSESGKEFKVSQIKQAAGNTDWVVFIDDSTEYIKAVLDSGIQNCLAINVPQGLIRPDFDHDHLIVIGRHPSGTQSIYPLYRYYKLATDSQI